MAGWGSYVKPKKSKQQVALERRRGLGNKFFTPIDELRQLAAPAKVKVKRLLYVPPEDPAVASARTDPGVPVTGPCQAWIDGHRRWREAGRARGKAATPEPTERRRKSRRPGPEQGAISEDKVDEARIRGGVSTKALCQRSGAFPSTCCDDTL
jgi:hypothetical protein